MQFLLATTEAINAFQIHVFAEGCIHLQPDCGRAHQGEVFAQSDGRDARTRDNPSKICGINSLLFVRVFKVVFHCSVGFGVCWGFLAEFCRSAELVSYCR